MKIILKSVHSVLYTSTQYYFFVFHMGTPILDLSEKAEKQSNGTPKMRNINIICLLCYLQHRIILVCNKTAGDSCWSNSY